MTATRYFPLLLLPTMLSCDGNGTGPEELPPTHPLGNIDATLELDGRPHGVAVASSGIFYISRIADDSVTRGQVDSLTEAFTGSAAVGDTPAHVALTPDGRTAFTADQYGNTVSVVDVVTNRQTHEIPLSDGGFNLLVSPDGNRLYVTTAAGILHIINVATLQVIETVSVGEAANGLAIDADAQRVYVSSIFANRVTAINTTTNQIERTYEVAEMPQRIAVNSTGDELYIASEEVGLEVLNLSSGAHTPVPGVGEGAVGLALSPDEEVLYITRPPAGELVIVDRGSRQVVKTFSFLARPRNVAFAVNGRVALVTGEGGVVYFIR
ncbi:MAG: YncE family protein [Gemmatimonadota bacterium]|nr:MAG: YncE family protein [Gemmatimonadota bacterium]